MKKLGNIIPIVGWLLAVPLLLFYWFAPASWWVDNASLEITNAMVGGPPPTVTLSATYEKSILVHWTRILHKQSDDDEWFPACDVETAGMSYPGNQTSKTTLPDLFEQRPCATNLLPGDYYVEADLEWDDGSRRNLPIESNIFTIAQAPAPVARRPLPPVVAIPAPEPARPHFRRRPAASTVPWPFSIFMNHGAR